MQRQITFGLIISVVFVSGIMCGYQYLTRRFGPIKPAERSFSAVGINRVILRTSQYFTIKQSTSTSGYIHVSGMPSDRQESYYAFNGDTRTEHPQDIGMDFVSRRYGKTLVISSTRETGCLEIGFNLDNIRVQIPNGIKFEKEGTAECAHGEPALGPPT